MEATIAGGVMNDHSINHLCLSSGCYKNEKSTIEAYATSMIRTKPNNLTTTLMLNFKGIFHG